MKPKVNLFLKPALFLINAVIFFFIFAPAQVVYAGESCKENKESPSPYTVNIEDVNWLLEKIGDRTISHSAEKKPVYIKFDARKKRVSGFAGCNTFFGGYKLNGSKLSVGPLGSTRMACPEPYAGLETAFLKSLEISRVWKIQGDRLFLLLDSTILAIFNVENEETALPDLNSMTFLSTFFPSGKVTLVNGEYRELSAPGAASETVVKLTEKRVFGKLNGKPIGAAVLVTETGGSGVFYDLALLSKEKDGWTNSDIFSLGDRVNIDLMAITDDAISLAMNIHKDADPMCCPSYKVVKHFSVRNGRITPLQDEVRAKDNPNLIGPVWQWVRTLYNNDTKTVPPVYRDYTVQFMSNGGINVKADCNMKGGTYSIKDGKLSINIINSTMAMCQEGSLEDQFVKDLTAGERLFLNKGDLYIGLKFDTGTMKFEAYKDEDTD